MIKLDWSLVGNMFSLSVQKLQNFFCKTIVCQKYTALSTFPEPSFGIIFCNRRNSFWFFLYFKKIVRFYLLWNISPDFASRVMRKWLSGKTRQKRTRESDRTQKVRHATLRIVPRSQWLIDPFQFNAEAHTHNRHRTTHSFSTIVHLFIHFFSTKKGESGKKNVGAILL